MTEAESHEVVTILADAWRVSERRLDFYRRALVRFPAVAVADVLEHLTESERSVPTIAQIQKAVQQRMETLGAASPTFAPRGERMEHLIVWRSLIEDPQAGYRQDAWNRVRWMDPPCTPAEWREARQIADARHAERNRRLAAEGKPARPPRPVGEQFDVPGPAEPQPILSRAAHRAGFAALFDGMTRRLPGPEMVRHVVAAVRSAEHAATEPPQAGGEDW